MNSMIIAAAMSDAGKNLFDEAWTTGNLYSINGIVSKLGSFSCWVISIIGFGIVIFSILKNAISGLYVVNPNFWDKVSEVKNQAVSGVSNTISQGIPGGNVAAQKLGGVLTFLLSLIPDIRQLTDFEDGAEIDKKQYFTKSLLALVGQIFIGMLIFFGYPAKIANWIGSGATFAVSAVINNVDPVELTSKISDSFTVYNLSTDGSQDPWEQNINKMTSEMLSAMATRYNDMDKSNIQNVAYDIEAKLLADFDSGDIKRILGATQGYVFSINTTIQSTPGTVSSSYKPVNDNGNVYQAVATNGTVSFKYWFLSEDVLTSQHTMKVSSGDTMMWSVTATPVTVANISSSSLILCGGIEAQGTEFTSDKTVKYAIHGITLGTGNDALKGSLGRTVTVTAINDEGSSIGSASATLSTASVTNTNDGNLNLIFSSTDKSKINSWLKKKNEYKNFSHLEINLSGDWNITVSGDDNKATTTVRVSQFRLVPGVTEKTYLISSWTDVDAKTKEGFGTLNSMTLKAGSLNELTKK